MAAGTRSGIGVRSVTSLAVADSTLEPGDNHGIDLESNGLRCQIERIVLRDNIT